MKFWFTQPARSRATQRRRRSLSTCSTNFFASSAVAGVVAATSTVFGQGAAGTGSAPPQPDATDASGARSASDAKESGASDERSLALRFTTLLLLRH